MDKTKVNVKEILQDIHSGMNDTALKEKYQLSEKGLEFVFEKLVGSGKLEQGELEKRTAETGKAVEVIWKCPACGKPQTRQSDVCPDCGVIVAKFREAPVQGELDDTQGRKIVEEEKTGKYVWKCSYCGKSQTKPFDQCPECKATIGSRVETQLSEQVEETSQAQGGDERPSFAKLKTVVKKHKLATQAGVVVVILVGVTILIFWLMDRSWEQSQLFSCAMFGYTDSIPSNLAKGAKINARDDLGRTPLIWAAERGHIDTVKLLLHYGAKVNIKDSSGASALIAAFSNGHIEVAELLKDNGATLTSKDRERTFHSACYYGKLEVVKSFVEQGVNIEVPDSEGYTALHDASGEGHDDIVEFLLQHGANVNARSHDGWTPLLRACLRDKIQTMSKLLSYGADINARNNRRQTVVDIAASRGNVPLMEFLKEHGVK